MSDFLFKIKNFVVLKDKTAYIVYNKNKLWDNGHTHVNNISMCRTIIDLVIKEQLPKTNDIWVYQSILRVSSKSQSKYRKLITQKMDMIMLNNKKKEE